MGQGPIGLMFTMRPARCARARGPTDTIEPRLALPDAAGPPFSWDPGRPGRRRPGKISHEGRGADIVIVAASAPEIVGQAIGLFAPGARILSFAQTSDTELRSFGG